MLFGTKEKIHQKQTKLSAEEAHRLWAKAQFRYILIGNLSFFANYVHDIDLKAFLKKLQKNYQNDAKILENELSKYSIKSPEPNKTDIEAIANKEIITDKQIIRTIYSLVQLALANCMKTLHNVTFNDEIRELLIQITMHDINNFFDIIDYSKLKGWLPYPPLYPNINEDKIVAANEIWELWQHLYYRYIHIQKTKIYVRNVSDKDFQIILNKGIEILEKQAEKIERILLDYGVSLPDRYPKNIPGTETKENYDDEFIFHILLSAMKNATTVHGFALMEIVVNNRLRNLFKDLLFEEISLVDKLIKYGKIKGWVPLVPAYRT